MDMMLAWSVGPMELAVVLAVAVFVFGPKRLPELGEAVGRGIKSFKKATKEPTEEEKAKEDQAKREKEAQEAEA